MKRVITVILAIALLATLATSAAADALTLYARKDGVRVYAKKSTDARVYRKLSRGEKVLIEEKSGKWYAILVEDPSGDGQTLGWIQARNLSATKPSKAKKKKAAQAPKAAVSPREEIDRVMATMQDVEPYEAEVVTVTENGTVALRWKPTTGGELILDLENGSRVRVVAEGDGWDQVTDPESGYTGYMAGEYLVRVDELADDEAEEIGPEDAAATEPDDPAGASE